ncbi:anti-sigma factor family protein [Antribacter gilvus]|uniref:anti-sigma factor family protein n=1 Tax=Antribacter gilvus TaxID=2304675 RepID=UPI000F7B4396|nr:zf-HC2 domain-containing protein [Antribacter gilvus]
MNGHLGAWLSALADGQLSPAETERALAHVAVCRTCARELDAERSARRALLSAGDVVPDPALMARLMALQASIPPADADPLRSPERYAAVWTPAYPGEGDFSGNLTRSARRRRTARVTALGAGGLGVLGMALFALGDAPVVDPDLSVQASMTLLGRVGPHENAAGEDVLAGLGTPAATDPTSGALGWIEQNGWVAPESLPHGFEVTALRLVGAEGQVLEIDLAGPQGEAVVREQVGRLAEGAEAYDVAGRDAVLLTTEPAHVAWQSEDLVVDVVAHVPDHVLEDLVAAFPGHGYDAGVLPRIARGWTTVTGAIASP